MSPDDNYSIGFVNNGCRLLVLFVSLVVREDHDETVEHTTLTDGSNATLDIEGINKAAHRNERNHCIVIVWYYR